MWHSIKEGNREKQRWRLSCRDRASPRAVEWRASRGLDWEARESYCSSFVLENTVLGYVYAPRTCSDGSELPLTTRTHKQPRAYLRT